MSAREAPASGNADRKAQFLALADALRPELHRYCARLVGSSIDGEDVVQDTFVRALLALEDLEEGAPMRAWLFRIAHNRALDVLRARAVRQAEPIEAAHETADPEALNPAEAVMKQQAIATALSRFVQLPTLQRSAVILKDVLGQSLEEIADLLDLTVNAVKAHLVRGRAGLRDINARTSEISEPRLHSPAVLRYVALFNLRDWDGLRALLAEDVGLAQSTHLPRTGAKDVGMFFGIYSRSAPVRLAPAWLDGREVIAVYDDPPSAQPTHLMWLEWRDGQISFIRDYKYVPYILHGADLAFAPKSTPTDV